MNDSERSASPQLSYGLDYFLGMYRSDPDPWGFDSRWYEQRKFDLSVAALPNARYRRALEPGCANGALTGRLALRCEELIAYDVVEEVVERAGARMVAHPNVSVAHASFPSFWPDGTGDLVVLSEVAYYLTADGRATAAAGLERWLEPGGDLLAVHYTRPTSYPMAGAEVGGWIDALSFLHRRVTHVEEDFELGVWRRTDAQAEPPAGR